MNKYICIFLDCMSLCMYVMNEGVYVCKYTVFELNFNNFNLLIQFLRPHLFQLQYE